MVDGGGCSGSLREGGWWDGWAAGQETGALWCGALLLAGRARCPWPGGVAGEVYADEGSWRFVVMWLLCVLQALILLGLVGLGKGEDGVVVACACLLCSESDWDCVGGMAGLDCRRPQVLPWRVLGRFLWARAGSLLWSSLALIAAARALAAWQFIHRSKMGCCCVIDAVSPLELQAGACLHGADLTVWLVAEPCCDVD